MVETRHCEQKTAMSWPCAGEGGRTGDWRSTKPVLDPEKCIAVKRDSIVCMLCWVFCPDNVITRTAPPEIDLEYCKGCGICMEVCPSKAIIMVPENEGQPALNVEDTGCDV